MITADKIEDHQARCQPYMLRLRMIALAEAGTALNWQAVTEVVQATEAILAEAQAAGSDAGTTGRSGGRDVPERKAAPALRPPPTTRSPPPGKATLASCAVTCTGSRC